jgi:hypothetical protein
MAACLACTEALKKIGVLQGGSHLQASADCDDHTRRGWQAAGFRWSPVDSKEEPGGYYIIGVADLAAASRGRRAAWLLVTGC